MIYGSFQWNTQSDFYHIFVLNNYRLSHERVVRRVNVNTHYLVIILKYSNAFLAASLRASAAEFSPIPKHTATGFVASCTKQWNLSDLDFSSTSTYVIVNSCSSPISSKYFSKSVTLESGSSK